MRTAFKEWAVICEALGSGRQSIILRKGGIHEGRGGFEFSHQEFALFPTRFHEQAAHVREGELPAGWKAAENEFEVGEEVAARFDARFVERTRGEKPYVDLPAAACSLLVQLSAKQIDRTDRCTYTHADEFFSHRRDVTHQGHAATGRMSSVIGRA